MHEADEHRIHAGIRYEPKSTWIEMPLLTVLENRRSVCRDLAHVMIGALRFLRFAARYVSWYLRSGAAVGPSSLKPSGWALLLAHRSATLPHMAKIFLCLIMLLPALAQKVEVAAEVAALEGPTADREGNIYFSDMPAKRIMKLAKDGAVSTYRENSDTNGLVIDPQGRLVACERGAKPRITRTDLRTGKVEVLAENYQGAPFGAPNDVTIDGKGRLYFTDSPAAAVYRIDAPGKLSRILAKPDIQRPNGVQISPDDKTLYLVEANRAKDGARMIRSYDLQADGTVRNMKVFYNFYPGRSADGMSIDTQGNLYASAGLNRLREQPPGENMTLDTKAGVYIISPQGKLLKFIPIPEDGITNNAFGGPDMKTLYITAGKTLFKVRTEIPGLPR